MDNKALNLLGMARRADKISLGHDASVTSIKEKKAWLCVLSQDASERLKNEMSRLCETGKAECTVVDCTMNELGASLGYKTTAVLTLNDRGFAERLTQLIREE